MRMRSKIVGILNVTPDSFSDGGSYFAFDAAIARAEQMTKEGADIIDVGGESSRPGSEPVSEEEELRRVIPVVGQLAKEKFSLPISIDTYKPKVAEEALAAGASLLNDITGLTNPEMRAVAARAKAPVILMHMQGKPKTMQENPVYDDVVADIKEFFKTQIALAKKDGITELILDPGIGFGKTLEHNLVILKRLHEFIDLGFPILVGPSRKSFIGALTSLPGQGGVPAVERLGGTLAAVTAARLNGASYFRVHDVKECRRALQVADAIANA
jgi:dihydropteroate synthase